MIIISVVVPALGLLIIIAAVIAFRIQAIRAAREEDHWAEDESRLAARPPNLPDDAILPDDDFDDEDIPEFTAGHRSTVKEVEWETGDLLVAPAAGSSSRSRRASPSVPLAAPVDVGAYERTQATKATYGSGDDKNGRNGAAPHSFGRGGSGFHPMDRADALDQPASDRITGNHVVSDHATGGHAIVDQVAGNHNAWRGHATTGDRDAWNDRNVLGDQVSGSGTTDADADDDDPWTRLSFKRPTWPSEPAAEPAAEAAAEAGPQRSRRIGRPPGGPIGAQASAADDGRYGTHPRRLPTVTELVQQIQTERRPLDRGDRRPRPASPHSSPKPAGSADAAHPTRSAHPADTTANRPRTESPRTDMTGQSWTAPQVRTPQRDERPTQPLPLVDLPRPTGPYPLPPPAVSGTPRGGTGPQPVVPIPRRPGDDVDDRTGRTGRADGSGPGPGSGSGPGPSEGSVSPPTGRLCRERISGLGSTGEIRLPGHSTEGGHPAVRSDDLSPYGTSRPGPARHQPGGGPRSAPHGQPQHGRAPFEPVAHEPVAHEPVPYEHVPYGKAQHGVGGADRVGHADRAELRERNGHTERMEQLDVPGQSGRRKPIVHRHPADGRWRP